MQIVLTDDELIKRFRELAAADGSIVMEAVKHAADFERILGGIKERKQQIERELEDVKKTMTERNINILT